MPVSGSQPSGSSGSTQNPGLVENYTDRVDPAHHGDPDQRHIQESPVVPSEAGSEAQEPEPHYLASINQVYKLIFNTLDDNFCQPPIQSIIGSAVTVTEKVVRRREPDRVGRATDRVDLRLPIVSMITSAFDSMVAANKPSNQHTKAPRDLAESKPVEGRKSYKPIRPLVWIYLSFHPGMLT